MGHPTGWQTARELPLGLAIAFCLGMRVVFHHLYGLSFDPSVIWWQMLDTELLRTAPLQSIYLMHMQPPLLNLLYAAALALPGETGFLMLQILFVGASLGLVGMLYALLRRFGARPYSAGTAAALFGVLPQVLLYENIYFYSHLEAVLVLAAALFASGYFERRRLGSFIAFAACLVALGLLRSLFHLGWIVVVLASACALASRHPGWDRRVVLVSVLASLLVGSLYLKNLEEFGIFSASSWDGISLMSMTLPTRGRDVLKFSQVIEDVRQGVDRGEFSPATKAALDGPDLWTAWVQFAKPCAESHEQRPVLCAITRSNGEPNLNHVAVIGYSRSLGRDALHLLRLHPRVYVDHVGSSVFTFLGTPSWDYRLMRFALESYTDLWNALLLYEPTDSFRGTGRASGTWWDSVRNRLEASSLPLLIVIAAGSIFIVLAGARDAVGYWRRTRPTADWVVPMLVILLFVSVPNLINGVEAQRIRYSVEPLIYLGFIVCSMHLLRRRMRTA